MRARRLPALFHDRIGSRRGYPEQSGPQARALLQLLGMNTMVLSLGVLSLSLVASTARAASPEAVPSSSATDGDAAAVSSEAASSYRGSVRAFIEPGASDLKLAVRLGVQGEYWLDHRFGIGARFAGGEDSGLFGGAFRRAYTLEPQFAARFGWPHLQVVLVAGAGAGVATRGYDEHCLFACPSRPDTPSGDAPIALTSLEAAFLGYAGPIAFSFGGRAETTTLGGPIYLASAGIGWAIH